MKNKRKNGYYWVKPKKNGVVDLIYPNTWLIAEWVTNSEGGFWELTGLSTTFTDKSFSEIDEIPIVYDRYKNQSI